VNYSISPEMVRVDFFNERGKWKYTVAMKWDRYTSLADDLVYEDIQDTFKRCLREQFPDRFIGLTAICLEPYHKNTYPLMVRDWEVV